MSNLFRYAFKANHDDFRPVKFPPPGPYWCTGYAVNRSHATVVAYLPINESLYDWWPEANDIEAVEVDKVEFTDRFPKPAWYKE